MTFDANLKAMTESALLPKVVDTVLQGNVLTMRLLGNAMKWKGETLDKTVQTVAPTTGGSFSGLDTFDTSTSNTKQRLSFDLRAYYQSVVIPGMEADANKVSVNSADLIIESLEEAKNAMTDGIGTIFYDDGTGNSNKDFLGLNAIVDDGGEVATYGGLARGTYTTLAANETDVGGVLTLAAMASMYDSCRVGSDSPTIIIANPAQWTDYEALNQPTVSNNQDGYRMLSVRGKAVKPEALKGDMGFEALAYRGVPVVQDEKCDAGTMFFLNERHLAFYSLPSTLEGFTKINLSNSQIEGVTSFEQVSSNLNFSWSGYQRPVNQYGLIGQIILLGNLVSFNPNRHGVLNTLT